MSADLDRADHLLDLHRPGEAEQILRRYLASDPGSARALQLLTRALLRQDRSEEAVATARQAVAQDPTAPDGLLMLAVSLLDVDGEAAATEGVQVAEQAVRRAPYLWVTHYTLGRALLRGRRPRVRDAYAAALEAVRLAPHEADPHNLVGMCLADLRQPKDARIAYEHALRLDPHHAHALNNLAVLDLGGGKLAGATGALSAALRLRPQEGLLHRNFGVLLSALYARCGLVTVAGLIVVGVMAAAGATWTSRAPVGVVAFAGVGVLAHRQSRHLPKDAHLLGWNSLRRAMSVSPIATGLLALALIALALVAFAPLDLARMVAASALPALRVVGLVAFVAWVIRLAKRR